MVRPVEFAIDTDLSLGLKELLRQLEDLLVETRDGNMLYLDPT